MAPTLGQTVIYNQPFDEDPRSGTRQHAAIVTRDWGEGAPRNLTVFFANGDIEHIGSVSPVAHQSDSDRERVGSFELRAEDKGKLGGDGVFHRYTGYEKLDIQAADAGAGEGL